MSLHPQKASAAAFVVNRVVVGCEGVHGCSRVLARESWLLAAICLQGTVYICCGYAIRHGLQLYNTLSALNDTIMEDDGFVFTSYVW
jgi:hypothetical protein